MLKPPQDGILIFLSSCSHILCCYYYCRDATIGAHRHPMEPRLVQMLNLTSASWDSPSASMLNHVRPSSANLSPVCVRASCIGSNMPSPIFGPDPTPQRLTLQALKRRRDSLALHHEFMPGISWQKSCVTFGNPFITQYRTILIFVHLHKFWQTSAKSIPNLMKSNRPITIKIQFLIQP